jgi:hypothetical protein
MAWTTEGVTPNNKEDNFDRKVFVCNCSTLEHQIAIWYDDEDETLYFEPHLNDSLGFWFRLVTAVKYIFGVKSKFGAWDEVVLNRQDTNELMTYLTFKHGKSKKQLLQD